MLAVSLACAKAAANYKKLNLFESISQKVSMNFQYQ